MQEEALEKQQLLMVAGFGTTGPGGLELAVYTLGACLFTRCWASNCVPGSVLHAGDLDPEQVACALSSGSSDA